MKTVYKRAGFNLFLLSFLNHLVLSRLVNETDVVLYCDFHGHNRKNNVFMYGCNSRGDDALKLQERVFPLMMSKNANNKVEVLQLYTRSSWDCCWFFIAIIYNTIRLSSPLRVVSSGCKRVRKERGASPCGDLASKTATLWKPALEARLWVSLGIYLHAHLHVNVCYTSDCCQCEW